MNKKNWKISPDKEKHKRPWWQSESTSSTGLALGAIFFIAASAWYHFKNQSEDTPDAIPVITAEDGPSKIRPENADEARMEHEDKLVYDRLFSSQTETPLEERFLPEPEKPLTAEEYVEGSQLDAFEQEADERAGSFDQDRLLRDNALSQEILDDEMILNDHMSETLDEDEGPNLSTAVSQEEQDTGETGTAPTQSSDSVKTTKKYVQRPKSKEESSSRQNVKKSLVSPPKRIKVELRSAKPTEAKKPSHKLDFDTQTYTRKKVTTGYRVQVASVKTQQQAKKTWKQFEGLPIVKGQPVQFKKVDLGVHKGIYYRVQVGEFENHSAADNLCRRIKAAGRDCFVAKF